MAVLLRSGWQINKLSRLAWLPVETTSWCTQVVPMVLWPYMEVIFVGFLEFRVENEASIVTQHITDTSHARLLESLSIGRQFAGFLHATCHV